MKFILSGVLLLLGPATLVNAQAIKSEPPMRLFTTEEVAQIEVPNLRFEATPEDVDDFEKYFYFHREDTRFDEAYADIIECDSLASGISYYSGGGEPYPGYFASQYGLGGAIGGAIGSALADAIFGSAERRKIRRTNLRNCMGFKEYQRYGLSGELWKEFNFEEGHGRKAEDVREAALLQQAKTASGKKPITEVLEP